MPSEICQYASSLLPTQNAPLVLDCGVIRFSISFVLPICRTKNMSSCHAPQYSLELLVSAINCCGIIPGGAIGRCNDVSSQTTKETGILRSRKSLKICNLFFAADSSLIRPMPAKPLWARITRPVIKTSLETFRFHAGLEMGLVLGCNRIGAPPFNTPPPRPPARPCAESRFGVLVMFWFCPLMLAGTLERRSSPKANGLIR